MANNFKKKINDKLLKPLLDFLKQGMTPTGLALSVSLGFILGLFPVVGTTTVLCLLIALIFKLNVAAVQLINYIVYPLQLLLIIPLINLGSKILNVNPIPYTISELVDLVKNDFLLALKQLWLAHLMGIFAWLIIIIPLGVTLYFSLRIVFQKMAKA
ncbi:DUF2062 domain-containing protein [Fulvivirga lutimaris]|uniref:DUF2062 domain-containing protein n=1 Tax=Fulvivirga lutimaris TaxID=1819566 RepID=UPI0012BBC0D5|nr:DUF2062 domain-containing protein [Fulvivirga lutimaris]MTI41380.1 DUF2062 domain-containing protein [Fulvivirga lutimaris]